MNSNNNFLNIVKSYCNIDKLNIIKNNKNISKTKNNKNISKTKNNKDTFKTKNNKDTFKTKNNKNTFKTKNNKDTLKTKNNKDTFKIKNNKFIPKTKKDLTDAITCYMTDKKLALNIFGDIYTWDLSKINVSFYMIYLLIKNFKNVKKLFLE